MDAWASRFYSTVTATATSTVTATAPAATGETLLTETNAAGLPHLTTSQIASLAINILAMWLSTLSRCMGIVPSITTYLVEIRILHWQHPLVVYGLSLTASFFAVLLSHASFMLYTGRAIAQYMDYYPYDIVAPMTTEEARKAAQTEIEANWDTATWSYVVMWFTTILTTMTFLVGCYVRYNDFTARWLKRNAKAATFPGKQFGLADVRLTIEALIDYAPVVEVVSASRLEEKKNQ